MTKEIHSILLVKTSAIGDVIQTFPVLEYLRTRFPLSRIDWIVEKGIAPLLQAHPLLSNVLTMDSQEWRKRPFSLQTWQALHSFRERLRHNRYDLLFDLQANMKSAVVTGSAKALEKIGFGWSSAREKGNLLSTTKRFSVPSHLNVRLAYLRLVQLYFNDDENFSSKGIRLKINLLEQQRLQEMLGRAGDRMRLMICFGSKWRNKQLETASWIDLLKRIRSHYDPFFFFIFSNETEKLIAEEMAHHFPNAASCVGALSLPLWQALMWEMDRVLSVDSAALHLCGTTTTPSFSIFGPSLATSYKPLEERHHAFQGVCPYNKTFGPRCPVLRTCKTGACVRQLKGEQLFDAFQASLLLTHTRS